MTDKNVQIYFFVAVFLAVVALNVAVFVPFVGAMVLALILAVVFDPIYHRLLKWFHGRAGGAALATTLLTVLIIIIPVAFLGTLVFKEAGVVYSVFRDGGGEAYVGDLNRIINAKLQAVSPGLAFDARAVFEKILNFFVRNLGSVFSGISGAVFSLFLALMALYYLLKDGQKLKRVIMNLSPLADEYDDQVFNKLAQTVSSVIKGALLVAVIQGALTGVGFFIFGIPNPAIWGALGVIAALIPMIGTALVIVPGLIYLFSAGSTGAAVGLLAWGVVIVGSVDNLLRPKLLERGINIHPFFILISVLGGLEFFGAVGFLLGPLLLSLLFSLLDIYKKEFKRDVEQV